jgi:hypothetical protein
MRSVKSGAAAMPMNPAIRGAMSRARSREIQPPIEEPTRICGPSVKTSMTAAASSRQSVIAPSTKAPCEAP